MIFRGNITLKSLQQKLPIKSVSFVSTSENESVVLIALTKVGEDSLLHFDKDSNLLYRYDFEQFIMSLCMPNRNTAIVLKPETSQIIIFHLPSKQPLSIKYEFMVRDGCQAYLDYFCETKLLCIHQNGDNEDQRMKLSYFCWAQLQQQSLKEANPSVTFIADSTIWDPTYQVRKTNGHSQYIWTQSRYKDQIIIKVHQVVIEGKKESNYYEKAISLNVLYLPYAMKQLQISIIEMWEFQPSVICLFCTSTKNSQNAVNPTTGVINNTFIWDFDQNTIRESNFHLDHKYQDLQVNVIGCQSFSIFPTFYFESGKRVASPMYFVNNKLEEIIQQGIWTCSEQQQFMVDPRQVNTILQVESALSDPSQIKLTTISLSSRADMSLFFLLELSKNYDYNFIYDVFKMTEYPEE